MPEPDRRPTAPTAAVPRIHLSAPDVSRAEEEALLQALRSGWIAPVGPDLEGFEQELADFCERKYCVALSSGTGALHLALLSHGIGDGDVVLTSTMTFVATVNAITYTGATPVLVDCDDNGLINSELLAAAIADQRRRGAHVAGVVSVDLLGKVADHQNIDAVANDTGVPVISDAAESLGACRDGRSAGSFGSAAVVSFNGNKIITTSGGGAVLTDDRQIADRVRYLSTQAREPTIHYEHGAIGYNYRLSNLLAGLGRAQLRRLPEMMERRRHTRGRYHELIDGRPGIELFGQPDGRFGGTTVDNFWLTAITVDADVTGWSSSTLLRYLSAHQIESRPLWKPMHRQPAHLGLASYLDGTSERLFTSGLCLPSGSSMDDQSLERVLGCLERFLDEAGESERELSRQA